jgi:predicted regulator of amino acid metabolism with ACT domain
MMFLGYTDPFAGTGTDSKGTFSYLADIKKATIEAFSVKRIEDYFLTVEAKAKDLNKSLTTGLYEYAEIYRKTISDVYLENIELGFAFDDSSKLISSMASEMKRMVPFTQANATNALVLGKVIGETPEEVAKLIGQMTAYGNSQKKSIDVLNKATMTARAFGLDAKTLTKTVSDNIQKAQIYGFKNGVEGLTKMAAQAQRVGFDIKNAQAVSEDILEGGLEDAVKKSSELQSLGGNIGALGDPGQLYRMAMYDIEGLQDELIKASSSAVDFNETTGDFKIGGEEMLRLRQQAKILSLSYEEVAKGAINARKEQEIGARVGGLSKLTEDQRSLVASLAEIGPGGKVTLDIPGFGNIADLEAALKSDPNALAGALAKYQDDMNKTPVQIQTEMKDIALQTQSIQQQMSNTLISIQQQGIKTLENQGLGNTVLTALKNQTGLPGTDTESTITNLKNKITTEIGTVTTELTNFYTELKTLTNNVLTISVALAGYAATSLENVYTSLGGFTATTASATPVPQQSDAFVPAGGGKMVTGSFGKFLGDTKDDMLLSPGIGDFFNKYNESENILKSIGSPINKYNESQNNFKSIGGPKSGGDLSLLYKNATAQPSQNLVDLLTKSSSFSPTNTEITQKVEIGGKTEVTLNINTNIPQNLINEVLNTAQLKDTIMSTVNTRLSAEYSDKLSNAFITQKRG